MKTFNSDYFVLKTSKKIIISSVVLIPIKTLLKKLFNIFSFYIFFIMVNKYKINLFAKNKLSKIVFK